MKPTQSKDAFRNIRKRLLSYLSITLVVALGVGGFFTTRIMEHTLHKVADDYYNQVQLKDYELVSSAGFDESDLATLQNRKEVAAVEGGHVFPAILGKDGRRYSVQLLSLTERVGIPVLKKGRLPERPDECLIGEDTAADKAIAVGDEIDLSATYEALPGDLLTGRRFRVVGIANAPDYIRNHVTDTVMVPLTAFNTETTHGYYTRAFVRLEDDYNRDVISESYFAKIAPVTETMEDVAKTLEERQSARLQNEGNRLIDEEWASGQSQLEEARLKIEDGEATLERELAAGAQKLEQGERELNKAVADGKAELASAKAKLQDAEKQIAEGEAQLAQAKQVFAKVEKALNNQGMTLQEGVDTIHEAIAKAEALRDALKNSPYPAPYVDDPAVIAAWNDAKTFVHSGKGQKVVAAAAELAGDAIREYIAQLDEGIPLEDLLKLLDYLRNARQYLVDADKAVNLIVEKEAELAQAKQQVADGWKQYNAGVAELTAKEKEGRAQLQQGWDTYYREKAAAEAKLAEAKTAYEEAYEEAMKKLQEARDEAGGLAAHVVVQDRRDNPGYVDYRGITRSIAGAGRVFGILFLLIGALVCFSTLAIIIEEQKRLVGATKAFGLRNNEILKKYLLFGATATAAGAVLGVGVADVAAGLVLKFMDATNMYSLTLPWAKVTLLPCVVVGLGAVGLSVVISVMACLGLLRSPASVLMNGTTLRERQKQDRKKNRDAGRGGSLYGRLIMRNMADDLPRILVTVAIIAGSVLMVGVGFNLKFGVDAMPGAELTEVYAYDVRVDLPDTLTDEQRKQAEDYLQTQGVDYVEATYEPHFYRPAEAVDAVYVLCASGKDMNRILTLRDPDTQEAFDLAADDILVFNRLAETAGMDKGDSLSLYGNDLAPTRGKVTGSYQNYQGRLLVMGKEAYRDTFGEEPETNAWYLSGSEDKLTVVEEGLAAIFPDIGFSRAGDFQARFAPVRNIYNLVIVIILGIAILMAFLILLNLTNIFVSRKKRDIIVMRVNGFSAKQAVGYLARETVFTTGVGLLLGLALGILLTAGAIRLVEQPDVQFVRDVSPLAWLLALVAEASFAILISVLAFRRTKNYQLREIADNL